MVLNKFSKYTTCEWVACDQYIKQICIRIGTRGTCLYQIFMREPPFLTVHSSVHFWLTYERHRWLGAPFHQIIHERSLSERANSPYPQVQHFSWWLIFFSFSSLSSFSWNDRFSDAKSNWLTTLNGSSSSRETSSLANFAWGISVSSVYSVNLFIQRTK